MTYLTGFTTGRGPRLGFTIPGLGSTILVLLGVVIFTVAVMPTMSSDLLPGLNVTMSSVADEGTVAQATAPQQPDLSLLENEICDYDFQIRSAPKIYSDAAVLEQKLHELMTKQIALIDEYNTRVDNWNGNVDSLVVLNMTAGAKMTYFSGCD